MIVLSVVAGEDVYVLDECFGLRLGLRGRCASASALLSEEMLEHFDEGAIAAHEMDCAGPVFCGVCEA